MSLAPTKTLIIGCVNVPAGTPWAPLCAAWVPIRTSVFKPGKLSSQAKRCLDAITNGQQTLKNEMSNMTSQVCSRRRDLSQSRRDPGIPGLLKVPIWNQHLKRHVYGPRIWHSRCSGLETFHVLEPCFRTGLPKFTSLLWDETSTWNLHLTFELDETWSLDHMKRPSSWVCLCVCVF